jgi:hypothetical protein
LGPGPDPDPDPEAEQQQAVVDRPLGPLCRFCARNHCRECEMLFVNFDWDAFKGKHEFLFLGRIEDKKPIMEFVNEINPLFDVRFSTGSYFVYGQLEFKTVICVRNYAFTKSSEKQ